MPDLFTIPPQPESLQQLLAVARRELIRLDAAMTKAEDLQDDTGELVPLRLFDELRAANEEVNRIERQIIEQAKEENQ